MFPRCHYIRNEADYDAFMEDYITTALIGTLKTIVQAIGENKKILSSNGNVRFSLIITEYFFLRYLFTVESKLNTVFKTRGAYKM